MLRVTILVLTCAFSLAFNGESKSFDGFSVIKVLGVKNRIPEVLSAFSEKNQKEFEIWNEHSPNGNILSHVSPKLKEKLLDLLESLQLNFVVVSKNMSNLIQEQVSQVEKNQNPDDSVNYAFKDGNFYTSYHQLSEIRSHLKSLGSKYPDIVSLKSIGMTWQRKEILLVELSKSKTKPVVFFECGIHAREWVSPASCLWIIGTILKNQEILNKWSFQFVPIMNPDGYQITWSSNRMWRKNARINNGRMRLRCNGVDLNRNLDAAFGTIGSSADPCSDSYQGPSAFSEPETRALRDHIKEDQERIKVYFSFHSFSQFWMYPYGYGSKPASNAEQLNRLSELATEAIEGTFGEKYKFGDIETVIYPTSGDTIDWVHQETPVKVAFAVELRDTGDEGFLLNPKWIEPTATEVWNGVKAVLENV